MGVSAVSFYCMLFLFLLKTSAWSFESIRFGLNHVSERLLFLPMDFHGTPVFSISFWFTQTHTHTHTHNTHTYIYIYISIFVYLSMSLLNCLLFVLIIKWARYLHTITICIRNMCCISCHCSTQCNTFVEIMIHGFIRLRCSIKLAWQTTMISWSILVTHRFKIQIRFFGLLATRLKAHIF